MFDNHGLHNKPKNDDYLRIVFYTTSNEFDGTLELNIGGGSGNVVVNDTTTFYNFITSFRMEKDFFTPSDRATFIIESELEALTTIQHYVQKGNRVEIYLNGNLNFVGYIFDYRYDYDRTTNKLTIDMKDLLEWMAQGSIFPNFGFLGATDPAIKAFNRLGKSNGGLTNFHFPPAFTLRQCLDSIVNSFDYFLAIQNVFLQNHNEGIPLQFPTLEKIIVTTEDNTPGGTNKTRGNLTVASGFAAGIRIAGKKPKQFTKSMNKAINRLNTPEKGESYLDFMKRLCKMSGVYLKMAPGSDHEILAQSPTYDRTVESPLKIIHYRNSPENEQNNVLSAQLHFSLDKQPSCIIVEGNSLDENEFHLNDSKAVVVNELIGYVLIDKKEFITVNPLILMVPSVAFSIAELCNVGPNGIVNDGTNYQLLPLNVQVYLSRYNFDFGGSIGVCLPKYKTSNSAHTAEQLAYEATTEMAEEQDRALVFTYKLSGWTNNGCVWQPNMMVYVVEGQLSNGSPIQTKLWIQKVNYVKDRSGGTYVEVTCTLPYTHFAEISEHTNPPSDTNSNGNVWKTIPIHDIGEPNFQPNIPYTPNPNSSPNSDSNPDDGNGPDNNPPFELPF